MSNLCDKIFSHKWLDPECVESGCQSLQLQTLRDERDRLREALERVLEQWVNGRKVKDGICMEVLVAAKAALTPAGGGQNEHK